MNLITTPVYLIFGYELKDVLNGQEKHSPSVDMWDLNAEALCVFQLTCRILAQGLSERQALIKISVKG